MLEDYHMKFNPFESRACRDIRNSLGHAFVSAIEKRDKSHFHEQARAGLSNRTEKCIVSYVDTLSRQFDKAYEQIGRLNEPGDIFYRGCCILWNLELFFECHEWLEKKWTHAAGGEKKMLQALILACVVYEQIKYKRLTAAGKVGLKAANLLESSMEHLPHFIDSKSLISALVQLSPAPRLDRK